MKIGGDIKFNLKIKNFKKIFRYCITQYGKFGPEGLKYSYY